MRGIVAEVNGKKAVVLAQDGTFKKIKASANMSIGSEVDLSQPSANTKVIRLVTRVSSIAAAALFAVGVGYGAYCYTLPYSYVDVDINPSVELTANVYDRIIKVEALNEDASKLLTNHNLKNARLDDGISQLLNIAVEQGYLKAGAVMNGKITTPAAIKPGNDNMAEGQTVPATETVAENAVLFTVSSSDTDKSVKLKKKIVKKVSEELGRSNVNSDVLAGEASIQQRDDARVLGVTPGKLALIEDAMDGQPGLKLEELKKSAVQGLIKKARAKKAANNKAANNKAANNKATPKSAELNKSIDEEEQQVAPVEQGETVDTTQGLESSTLIPTEEMKRVQELKKAQNLKRAQEEKKAQEEKRVQELQKAQEEKKVQELRKTQEEKRVQELKKAQEEKRTQELQKAQEEKRVQELRKTQEEKRAQELRKTQQEKRAQELKKAREEKKAEELQKAQEEKEAKAAAVSEEKKNQRQKLKDELLDQIQLRGQEQENKKVQDNSGNRRDTGNRDNRPGRKSVDRE
jgi:hypothetical protein